MIRGMEKFREYFSEFCDCYVLIGGAACNLIMENAGGDFRVTKDIDIVLIIEKNNPQFAANLIKFLEDGDYENREKTNGKIELYRFMNPSDKSFPEMIEISTRNTSPVYKINRKYEKIKLAENISSLSAILLDHAYYDFLLGGHVKIDGISILDAAHLMPFKAKAYLDLCYQKENGVHVDSKNIKKHLNDFIRLYDYLDFSSTISLPDDIANDMKLFLRELSKKDVNFKQLGVHVDSVKALVGNLYTYFSLT